MSFHSQLAAWAFRSACIAVLVGCSGGEGVVATDATSDAQMRLRVLANEYGEFVNARQGRVPKDEAEFRKHLEQRFDAFRADFDVQTMDELLTSPRDNQPLVIVAGKRIEPAEAPGAPWALRERTGVDGLVLAVGVRYGPVELTIEEAKAQMPDN
jgi:hypothetical protein